MSTITYADIVSARERIAPYAIKTPVLVSSELDGTLGGRIFFKCENLQRTGSFKFRGATNARGVLAHSSGNHGQALAEGAQLFGIPAYIVVPKDAPAVKIEAIKAYGGEVIPCAPNQRSREETAAGVGKRTGAVMIDSHDDPLIEEAGPLDMILVPVGGGGLISGTAIAAHGASPGTEVIGCEPAGADDAYRSLAEGRRITNFTPRTIADGLRTPLGELTFSIIEERIETIVRVEDEETIGAIRLILEGLKVVIEPSAAVAVAPLLSGSLPIEGKRVGVILSGGNIGAEALTRLLDPDNRRHQHPAG